MSLSQITVTPPGCYRITLGHLGESPLLYKQVERLLDDSRSRRFSRSFADQRLSLDTLKFSE